MLHGDAEELLAHEEDVPVDHLGLALDADERAVRAPEVGEVELAVLGREAAVQARDVAVFGEEDVAALAAEVDAGGGDRIALPVASRPITSAIRPM